MIFAVLIILFTYFYTAITINPVSYTHLDVYKRQVLESMDFPEPVIGIAVEPKTQKDMDKLSNGLAKPVSYTHLVWNSKNSVR